MIGAVGALREVAREQAARVGIALALLHVGQAIVVGIPRGHRLASPVIKTELALPSASSIAVAVPVRAAAAGHRLTGAGKFTERQPITAELPGGVR